MNKKLKRVGAIHRKKQRIHKTRVKEQKAKAQAENKAKPVSEQKVKATPEQKQEPVITTEAPPESATSDTV